MVINSRGKQIISDLIMVEKQNSQFTDLERVAFKSTQRHRL